MWLRHPDGWMGGSGCIRFNSQTEVCCRDDCWGMVGVTLFMLTTFRSMLTYQCIANCDEPVFPMTAHLSTCLQVVSKCWICFALLVYTGWGFSPLLLWCWRSYSSVWRGFPTIFFPFIHCMFDLLIQVHPGGWCHNSQQLKRMQFVCKKSYKLHSMLTWWKKFGWPANCKLATHAIISSRGWTNVYILKEYLLCWLLPSAYVHTCKHESRPSAYFSSYCLPGRHLLLSKAKHLKERYLWKALLLNMLGDLAWEAYT